MKTKNSQAALTKGKGNKIKKSTGYKVSQICIYIILALFAFCCILPFVLVLIVSFTDEKMVTINGYSFFPAAWSLSAYKLLFSPTSSIPRSYYVTTVSTVVGTFIAALITFGAGYTLANKRCKYRNGLSLYFYITMVFSAGMVPWYMISKKIGCFDNIWALIVPSLMFSPFNMFLVRNFVKGIPEELDESALIDGAGDLKIAFSIYFPLCKPVLATITLFYAIGYWNNYFNAVMLVNNQDFYNLQMMLLKIQSEITALSRVATGAMRASPPKENFKMATSVIAMGPIVLLYPLLQKHFVKGMVVGAVKG